MPNGFHGSDAEWQRIEAPLQRLDAKLDAFSERWNVHLTRSARNWPSRSLEWGEPVRRLIQIFLADETSLKFNLWLCASEDRGGERYWKQDFLKKEVPISEIDAELPELLERGRLLLESWGAEMLEFATPLRSRP